MEDHPPSSVSTMSTSMSTSIDAIELRIREIISESTDYSPEDLAENRDAHLHKDLSIDSLTLLEVALSIDQEFQTDFSEEELLGMESVNKAAGMVVDRLEESTDTAAAG